MFCTFWCMTHANLIDLWPSLSAFADDMGIPYGTAKAMRRRNSIPSSYWALAVSKAQSRGIRNVSLEALTAAVAAKARPDVFGSIPEKAA